MKKRLPKRALISAKMVRIEKCLHFKVKCRHNPQFVLDILPVYLTGGISRQIDEILF